MQRLKSLRTIVTGAGTGIGRATAQRLASEGSSVVVADISLDNAENTAKLINNQGGDAIAVYADMSKEKDIHELVATTVSKFGGVDILVNNAARFWFGDLDQVKRENWDHVFQTNVLGYATAIQAVLPHMRKSGKGTVINIASVSSFIAQPQMFVYNASKGAVLQLTKCLAMDLAKDNIRVNAICPGAIFTEASKRHMDFLKLDVETGKREFGNSNLMKRIGKPEEIASVVAFLASDDSSFMTGEHIVVDGGGTI